MYVYVYKDFKEAYLHYCKIAELPNVVIAPS